MDTTSFKGKSVLKWALTGGIVIVLNLFFAVAIQTVYPEPKFENFCEVRQVNEVYEDEASCVAASGQWNANVFAPKLEAGANQPAGWCDVNFICGQAYRDAEQDYTRNVFVALIVLGAIAIGAGFLLRASPAVAAGLSYGGVVSFVIAAIRYWGEAGDVVRLAIVGLALIILIVIGVKKFKE